MTTPVIATPVIVLPLSHPEGGPVTKKKRVLLLDTSQTKRDLRADVMRKLGIDVDCAADVIEARCWWRADLYNLVLINVAGETDSRDKFCTDIRNANPPQRIAFFVGGPEYLAAAPHSDEGPVEADADALHREMVAALLAQTSENSSQQRWGILEACRKISSVRSVSEARSRAIRETPRPSRWAEAIEQHSAPEAIKHQPLFAPETAAIETEREELL
jgi:DNA-binding NtrC family response regulator